MSFTKKDQDKAKRRQKVTKLSGLTESLIAPALGKKSAYLRQLIAIGLKSQAICRHGRNLQIFTLHARQMIKAH